MQKTPIILRRELKETLIETGLRLNQREISHTRSHRPVVLVSLPNTGWIHKSVVAVGMRLLTDPRYRVHLIMPTHIPYENNLHHIVRDFINGPYEFWLNIDADNPPMKNPLELTTLGLDIVGCPTPVFHFEDKKGENFIYWNAYIWNEEKEGYNECPSKVGLQEVDAVGTGCILIARRVFDSSEMQIAPFQRIYHEDGRVKFGNDLAFCQRAKKRGFTVWAHYEYGCDHVNEISLNDIVRGIVNRDLT